MPENTSPTTNSDPWASAFLIAMSLAAAVVAGASLSGVATGAVQDLLRAAGFGRDSEIMMEQRRQASALETIELSIGRARADIALLNARVDDAEKSHQDLAQASNSNVEQELDLGELRTSVDAQAERTRNEFSAINKRIDWLEKLVYSQDVTGSIPPATIPGRRQGAQPGAGWFVLHAEKGVAVIASKGGAIDVTPGFLVPELGRVAAIRQEGGRWVVVMDKGITLRER